MVWMIIAQLVTSFIASAGFGVLFNAPRGALIPAGVVGMLGWILYYVLVLQDLDIVPATVIAAILIGFLSHFAAKQFKTPILIFYVSGIIPLVPGGHAYNAMRHFVQNDYNTGLEFATKVLLLSGGIAIGLMFSEVANKVYKKVKLARS